MCIANLASLKEPVRWLVVYADKIIRSETDPATGEEGAANRLRETVRLSQSWKYGKLTQEMILSTMRNRKQRRFVATSAGNLQHTPNWGAGLPTGVDPLNFAAVKLQPFYNDIQLGNATGFFYFGFLGSKPNFWLVTNWHVLSGRNAEEPESVLHKMGSVPNRLRLSLLLEFDQPKYTSNPNAQILFQEQFIELYDKEGRASWYQHVKKSAIDVAVLNASVFVGRFHLVGINSAGTDADMAIQIGSPDFYIGIPARNQSACTGLDFRERHLSEPIYCPGICE